MYNSEILGNDFDLPVVSCDWFFAFLLLPVGCCTAEVILEVVKEPWFAINAVPELYYNKYWKILIYLRIIYGFKIDQKLHYSVTVYDFHTLNYFLLLEMRPLGQYLWVHHQCYLILMQ